MTELFKPTLDEMIECVEREIRMRRGVYPRRIAEHKMSREKAEREIDLMRGVLQVLQSASAETCK